MNIQITPIGFVERNDPQEDERDRNLATKVVLEDVLALS